MLIETFEKFGHPTTLVKEFEHWVILCRDAQVTLGSLILITKDDVTAFSRLSDDAFAELPVAIKSIEQTLKRAFGNDKINYFMLMMADPEVHFHVIPRYSRDVEFEGVMFQDRSWPGPADLKQKNEIDKNIFNALIEKLREEFKK